MMGICIERSVVNSSCNIDLCFVPFRIVRQAAVLNQGSGIVCQQWMWAFIAREEGQSFRGFIRVNIRLPKDF